MTYSLLGKGSKNSEFKIVGRINFRDCFFFDAQFRPKTICDFMDRNLVKVHKPREKKNVVNIQVCLVTKRVIICHIRHRFLHDKAGFTAQDFLVLGLSLQLHDLFLVLAISRDFRPRDEILKLSSQKNKNRNFCSVLMRKLVPVSRQLCAASDFVFSLLFLWKLSKF